MGRRVTPAERARATSLMRQGVSQREIAEITDLSRPYLRKLAKQVGHKFPRSGIDARGVLCMCAHCSNFFYRSESKVNRAEKNYCSVECKNWDMRGVQHHGWKGGDRTKTFSSWVTSQAEYKKWREAVLERCGYKCVVSGRDYDLHAHHIQPKAEYDTPEEAFNVDNGICLNKEVHTRLHQLTSQGVDPMSAMDQIRTEFLTKEEKNKEILKNLEVDVVEDDS